MAKGKKYRKWYESHREEIENRPKRAPKPPKVEEVKEDPQEDPVIVHGFMLYECQRCGTIYQMYLEEGLEDRVQDKIDPSKHKPVPFAIGCRACKKDHCNHILWGIGDSDNYGVLPEGASYFKNDPNSDCGVPVIGESFNSRDHWMREMSSRKEDIMSTILGGRK